MSRGVNVRGRKGNPRIFLFPHYPQVVESWWGEAGRVEELGVLWRVGEQSDSPRLCRVSLCQ